MKYLAIVIAFLCAPLFAAEPEMTATYEDPQGNSITVTLLSTPCSLPELTEHLAPAALPGFHSGVTVYNGKNYPNCWRLAPSGVVYIIDVGRGGGPDLYAVPILLFSPKEAI